MAIWVSKDTSQLADLKYELENNFDNNNFFGKIKNTKIFKFPIVFLRISLCKIKSKIHVAKWCSNSKRKIFLKSASQNTVFRN